MNTDIMLAEPEDDLPLLHHVQDLLCEYSRTHYTVDYEEFTCDAVAKVRGP